MKKRILSILLTLAMTLSLLPASALAAEQSFGVSMGGTQLEAGKYYRTGSDGTVEETAAENYEIYFVADDTNVYTLTINGAAEHEITLGSYTTLTVVDYSTAPGGNRATHVARDGGAVMIQSRDGNVTGEPENTSSLPTFIVMTSGKTDTTLAPGQTLTVAYPKEDGGYTNACPIQAAEANTADVGLFLRGDYGYSNSVILNPGVAVTMDGILYEFTNDVDSRALTMDFHMDLDSPTSDIHYAIGSLKISAPRAYTDIFNGYGFAENCTEAEFTFSTDSDGYSIISLTGGAIALDKWESVTVNDVLVVGAGSTVVTMDEATGRATVDGSAIIDGALETRGNPGDDDYRALVEIAADSTVILQEGDAKSLETTYFSLANGGTVTLSPETSITYNASESNLELTEGTITVNGVEDTVTTSYTDYSDEAVTTANIKFSPQNTDSFTLENNWDSVILSYISGDVNIAMEEGAELNYGASSDAKVIKAQSSIQSLTIREDGSIWAGETTAQPDADGTYVVGAAHETVTLGGFTVYGNPDGVSYNEEDGVLTIHAKGSYEITTEGGTARSSGVTSDTIYVDAGGSITLKGVQIVAAEGSALTIASGAALCIDGTNSLTGGAEASGLSLDNEFLSITGSGIISVIGSGAPAIVGNISVDGPTVIAAGGTGGNGDNGEPGIDGYVKVDSGSVTVTGGSAVPGSSGVGGTGITGNVTVENGTVSVAGGANSSGGTAPATTGNQVSARNVTLMPTAENTSFTLTTEAGSVQLSGIGGSANITLSGGSLIVQDASGNKQTITANNTESDTALTIDSTGSITGETGSVTIETVQSAPTVTVRYKVTANAENGTVNMDATRYQRGETVTFTITPDAGYVLESLTVIRKSGAEVAVTESDGIYSFRMPTSSVTVNAGFVLAFEDIESDHQFYEAIEWVYQQKLMEGISETTFDRVNPVTRQQVWRILARLINGEDPADMAAAKEWAVANGIADGTNPGTAATREEFVTMMWIALGKPAADTSILAQFPDADAISPDASAAMAWAVSEGIVEGYEDGTLRPAATTSRGAFAAVLYRHSSK